MDKSRCYACNRLVPDSELEQDIEGWKINEALCNTCFGTIEFTNYDLPIQISNDELDSEFEDE